MRLEVRAALILFRGASFFCKGSSWGACLAPKQPKNMAQNERSTPDGKHLLWITPLGLYLTLQPLVTWLGYRVQKLAAYQIVIVSTVVLLSLSAFGLWMERTVNVLTGKVLGKEKMERLDERF